MTATTETPPAVLAAFKEQSDKRAEDYATQCELAYELIRDSSQPLIAAEIAHVFQFHESTARNMVATLVSQAKIFGRKETKEERRLRAGGSLRATRATLYSTQCPVPPRTQRQAVDGYLQQPSAPVNPMGTREVSDRVAIGLHYYIRKGKFTAQELADYCGVAVETVRTRLDEAHKSGLLVRVPSKENPRWHSYRIPREAEDTLRDAGHDARSRIHPRTFQPRRIVASSRPPVAPFTANGVTPNAVHTTPTADAPEGPNIDVLEAIRNLVAPAPDAGLAADNARLQVENADLRDQLRRAKAALRAMTEGD